MLVGVAVLGLHTTTAAALPGDAVADATPPTIVAETNRRPNANGWHRRDVTVVFLCTDDVAVASCPAPVLVDTEGADQPVTATVSDTSGNTASVTVLVSLDKTAPILAAVQVPEATADGWTNGPFVLSFDAFDALSGIDSETLTPPREVSVAKAGRHWRGRVRDLAGNTARVRFPGARIDQDIPSIVVSLSPLPGAGFGRAPVTAHFTCSDATSGVALCPPDRTIEEDGANQTVTGTVIDRAGNAATVTSAAVSLDLTPPVLTISRPVAEAVVAGPTITIEGTLTDALSGIASLSCDGNEVAVQPDGRFVHGPLALVAGPNPFACVATDIAGNVVQRIVSVTRGCSNLVQDPGFETGVSGFVAQDSSSVVAQMGDFPIEGDHSLAVAIDGYGNNVWWIRDLDRVRASFFEVAAHLRSDVASMSDLEFCAMVYYADDTTDLACRTVDGDAGDKGLVHASLALDEAVALRSVRIRLYQEGGAAVQFSMDAASACLDVVEGSTGGPDGPPPPPPPPPPPGPSAYPGYTYHLPTVRPFVSLDDYAGADPDSAAYTRLQAAADAALAGNPPYAYSATHSVLMHRLTGRTDYLDDAIARVEAFVEDGEADIAAGGVPALAGDSYLEVGWFLEQLALAYDYGFERLSSAQRSRWQAFAEQALENVWNPAAASWGGTSHPWSGWSISDPGNNYHYSFLRATMLWALASQNIAWFDFLQAEKFGPLVDYYEALAGGGSREGTGYGTAQKNLFENYLYWKASTGEDLAGLTAHTRETIDYWIHATVPTLDRFAPIGDQSRSSIPELFDYHENLVHTAVVLSDGSAQAGRGRWWLEHNSVEGVVHAFNLAGDLLPYPTVATTPTALAYHAQAVGHFFARSGWDEAASWLAFVAGPYDQSHAHQDQGSFTFFKGDWLAVTANIWSHSGIHQEVDVHNVIRFERDGAVIPQNPGDSVRSSMSFTEEDGVVSVSADLSNAYWRNAALVNGWTRDLRYQGDVLRVTDRCTVAPGVRAVFQVQVPAEPELLGDGSIRAGALHIVPLQPVTVAVVSLVDAEFSAGYRIELATTAGCGFDVELRAE